LAEALAAFWARAGPALDSAQATATADSIAGGPKLRRAGLDTRRWCISVFVFILVSCCRSSMD
jgi:hypothetical protein